MQIITKTKNLELTEALQNYIDEKIGALKKFVDAEIFVEVEKETKHHNKGDIFFCQIEVALPGKSLISKPSSDDLYKAIVLAKKEMEQEIKKYKVKNVEKNRRLRRKTKEEISI